MGFPWSDLIQQWPIEYKTKRGIRGGQRSKVQKEKGVVGQGIYNPSTINLSPDEISLLDKGLKFAPPQRLNKFQTYMDIHKYTRKLSVKRYIMSNPIKIGRNVQTDVQHSNLANASLFNPP